VPRVKDRWRMHLLLKGPRAALSEVLARHPLEPSGSIQVDRDPLNFG